MDLRSSAPLLVEKKTFSHNLKKHTLLKKLGMEDQNHRAGETQPCQSTGGCSTALTPTSQT